MSLGYNQACARGVAGGPTDPKFERKSNRFNAE